MAWKAVLVKASLAIGVSKKACKKRAKAEVTEVLRGGRVLVAVSLCIASLCSETQNPEGF
jgi:hypothetical protein